jgi:metal-dependent amidase/aminoacylase/carboxypeptidase family protein
VFGSPRVLPNYKPTLGSEDFSFFLQLRPGAYFFIGTRPPEIPVLPGLHHPKFNFNDDILPLAITMHVEIARRFADDWARFSKS